MPNRNSSHGALTKQKFEKSLIDATYQLVVKNSR